MAKRLTKRQADGAKDAIQTGLLIKRLQDHVLNSAEMTQTQLRAAEILLSKTLPSIKAVEHSGPEGEAIEHKHEGIRFWDAKSSLESRTRDPLVEGDD